VFGLTKYPCKNCMVDPICKKSCNEFAKFIIPIDKQVDVLQDFFEKIDDKISQNTLMKRIFDLGGEKIITPMFFIYLKYIYRIKVHWDDKSLFDERYEHWTKNLE